MCLQYQQNNANEEVVTTVNDAVYNHHMHTSSCFGKEEKIPNLGRNTRNNNAQGKTTQRRPKHKYLKCQYRYPAAPARQTTIINASNTKLRWYLWNGNFTEQYVKEIVPKRQKYDAFHSMSCPAISRLRLTCNSNITVLMPGPST